MIYFVLILVSITAFILVRFNGLDLDLLWHYRMGQDIFVNHEISTVNTYSWISGTKWSQQEWLFDLLFYLTTSAFGLAGMYTIYILCLTALFVFAAKINQIQIKSDIFFVYFGLIILITIPAAQIGRPANYSTLLLPILVYLFEKSEKKRYYFIFFISGIVLSNFHCGQSMAIMVLLILDIVIEIFVCLILKEKPLFKQKIKYLILFLIGLFITPIGPKQLLSMFFVKSMETTAYLNEWQPLDFSSYPILFICVFFIFEFGYTFATSKDKNVLTRMILTLATLVYTIHCVKASILFIYLAITFSYPNIKSFISNLFKKVTNNKIDNCLYELSSKAIVTAYLIAVMFGISMLSFSNGLTFNTYVRSEQGNVIEEKTIDYLKTNCDQGLFHSYNISNYLLWNDIPVMVDTRQFPYELSNGVTSSCNDIFNLIYCTNSKESIDQIMDSYNIEYVLYDPSLSNISWYFTNNRDYKVILYDKYGNIIYKRI